MKSPIKVDDKNFLFNTVLVEFRFQKTVGKQNKFIDQGWEMISKIKGKAAVQR